MSNKNNKQQIDYKDMLFMEYANGSIDTANSALIAAYLTMNPEERAVMSKYEDMCASISLAHEQQCSDDLLKETLSLLDKAPNNQTQTPNVAHGKTPIGISKSDAAHIPAPILNYARDLNKELKFSTLFPGYERMVLSEDNAVHAELLRIGPDKPVAEHTHNSLELTLILDGAFEDDTGRYGKGSLIICDEDVHHQPVTDKELGCLCFTTRAQPLQYTGGFGKLLNLIFKS